MTEELPPLEPCHVILDGVLTGQPERGALHRLLNKLIHATGLREIAHSRRVVIEPEAWRAITLIAESHISLHGAGRLAWVDVFSCRPVDRDLVEHVVRETLGGAWHCDQMRRFSDPRELERMGVRI